MVVGAAVGLPNTMGIMVGEKVGKLGILLGGRVEGVVVIAVGEDDGNAVDVTSERSSKVGAETDVMLLATPFKSNKISPFVRSASRDDTEWLLESEVSKYEKDTDDVNKS